MNEKSFKMKLVILSIVVVVALLQIRESSGAPYEVYDNVASAASSSSSASSSSGFVKARKIVQPVEVEAWRESDSSSYQSTKQESSTSGSAFFADV